MVPSSVVNVEVSGQVTTPDDPSGLAIIMLCYVGVDGCSELSTAASMPERYFTMATTASTEVTSKSKTATDIYDSNSLSGTIGVSVENVF